MTGRARLSLAIGAAVIVPVTSMVLLTDPSRRAGGLLPPPLGPMSLGLSQVVCASPLGVAVARSSGRPRVPAALWPLAGLALAIVVPLVSPAAASRLDDAAIGPLGRDLARALLALGLVTPWIAWGVDQERRGVPVPASSWLIGAIVAILPPAAYADQIRLSRSAEARALLDAGRLTRALGVLEVLADLGQRMGPSRSALRKQITRSQRTAASPLPVHANDAAKVERAFVLIQLDFLDQADALLRSCSSMDADAALLRGAIARDRQDWAEAERVYRVLLRRDPTEDQALTAADGLAEALQHTGRGGEMVAIYEDLAHEFPARAAYCQVQMGRLEAERGRPWAALEHYDQALRLAPALGPEVAPLVRQLRVGGPACLLPTMTPTRSPDRGPLR
jgi:tetratricopeptide (TPR) repeat protein